MEFRESSYNLVFMKIGDDVPTQSIRLFDYDGTIKYDEQTTWVIKIYGDYLEEINRGRAIQNNIN